MALANDATTNSWQPSNLLSTIEEAVNFGVDNNVHISEHDTATAEMTPEPTTIILRKSRPKPRIIKEKQRKEARKKYKCHLRLATKKRCKNSKKKVKKQK